MRTGQEAGVFTSIPLVLVAMCLGAVSAEGGIILSDPLDGGTIGTRTGGRFTDGGWKAGAHSDYIVWKLPQTVTTPGWLQVQVTNWAPANQADVDKSNFVSIHSHAHGDQVAAIPDAGSYAMMRSGLNYVPDGKQKYISCPRTVPGVDGIGQLDYNRREASTSVNVPAWELSKTYTFRIEWDDSVIRFLIDGKESKRFPFGSLAPYAFRYVFLGHDFSLAGTGRSIVGPVWKNLEVYVEGAGAPPAVPAGLTARALSSSEIRLSWNDVADETQYKIRRSPDGVDWYAFEEVLLAPDTTSWTDTGLPPETMRYYKIKAWGEAGNSDYTAPVSATTPEAEPSAGIQALRVDSSGHFLVTEDGAPFVWQGDTLWGALSLGPADMDLYLDTRKAQGFNVVQMMAHRTDYAGNGPFSQRNPVKLKEAHWSYIDSIIAKAAARDMYVCMFLMWGSNADTLFPDPYNNNYRYGQLVGERYADNKAVLFAGSGEYHKIVWPDPSTVFMTPEQVTLIARIGEGLEAGHGGKRLNTLHPNAAGAKHSTGSSSQYYQARPWLDFNMIQTWGHPDHDITVVNADYNKTPAKPTLNGEPGYEDRHLNNYPDAGIMDPWHCRVEAYWALFSGAFGHTYGNSFVYFARSGWKTAVNSTGARDMQHWRRLLESRPVLIRQPYNAMITSSLGSKLGSATREPGDYRVATRASDRSYAFVYSTRGKGFTIDMSKISGSQANAWWYNPRDGKCYNNSGSAVTAPFAIYSASGTRTFNPPGPEGMDRDWVLVLDDASKGYGVPGGNASTPRIAVSTTSISVSCLEGEDAPDASFQVWNSGAGTLRYKIVEGSSKLDVAPMTDSSTGSGNKQTHTVTFHTSTLAAGTHQRSFTVEDNGSGASNGPITINVEIAVTVPVPAAPTGLAATALSPTSVELTWNDLPDETQYMLRKSLDGSYWYAFDPVYPAANVTSYTATGLDPETKHYFKIRGQNDGGNGPYSAPVSVTTPAATPPEIAVSTTTISTACVEGEDAPDATFQVWNSGPGTLRYKIVEGSSKLDVAPMTDSSTGSGNKQTHTVTFHTSTLAAGTHQRSFTVEDNGSGASNGPITINVEIVISAQVDTAVPVAKGASWSYREGTAEASSPAGAWRRLQFDATGWETGPAPFGYGDGPYGTTVTMRNLDTSLFLRKVFTVDSPARVSAINLWTLYDDGFVIWINGKEVARHNVAGTPDATPPFDATATNAVPNGTEWSKTLAGADLPVLAETNLLAIQVFNVGLSSSDLTLDAELSVEYSVPPGTDTDDDGMPDDWEEVYLSDLSAPSDRSDSGDPDNDGLSNIEEWVAGTEPTVNGSWLMVDVGIQAGQILVSFEAVPAEGTGYDGVTRRYSLQKRIDPALDAWTDVPSYADLAATAAETIVYSVPEYDAHAEFRVKVWLE